MLIDEVTLSVKAGNGAPGHVSLRREKFVPHGGPDGGNGGKGGNVYFVGVSDLTALSQFRSKKEVKAKDGGRGKSKKRHGANAPDLIVSIPVGTTIKNLETNAAFEINRVGQKMSIAHGGAGGRGNWELRTATHKTPSAAEPGEPGEARNLFLNLQFIADIGLIGLPNAGKSTLLNCLTNADVKTADYPFTTLEANLGVMDKKIIADIPGLIEGASAGRGLGIKFLKHIEKTKLLVHCIDCSSSNIKKDYQTIRNELKMFNEKLLSKKEIVLLTKIDLLSKDELILKQTVLEKEDHHILMVSVLDDDAISFLKKMLLHEI